MPTNRTKLSNGIEAWACTFTGIVLSSDRRSSTEVNQTMALPDGRGGMTPGQVYSVVHNEHEVWLRADDGREEVFNMATLNMRVRPGHRVTVVWAGVADDGRVLGPGTTRRAPLRSPRRSLG